MIDTNESKLEPKGLYNKYYIIKTDGTQIDPNAEFLVLRIDKGCSNKTWLAGARRAAAVLCDTIRFEMPELAKDIEKRYPLDIKI